jgi:pilus assembly protein CpaF
MRPDRIVVGEVRGAEVSDLMLALNTGHAGGATTVHANGADEVPARLEALGVLAGLPRSAVHSQMAAALDVVVHVVRGERRRVAAIGVLSRGDGDLVTTMPVLQRRSDGWQPGPGAALLGRLLRQRDVPVPTSLGPP